MRTPLLFTFAGLVLVVGSLWTLPIPAAGATPAPLFSNETTYCTGKVNSQGCYCFMTWNGTASASDPSSFDLIALNVLNNKAGLLFYGYAPNAIPFQGGLMCVLAPTKRTALQTSSGNPPPDDCSGLYTYDFNARIQSGVDPNLVVGANVYTQYWTRDGNVTSGTGLTDVFSFTIDP